MLNKKQEEKLSVMLCFFLRHKPEAAQISLSREGWTDIAIFIENINKYCQKQINAANIEAFTLDHLKQIVLNDNKRYSHDIDWTSLRCTQGHSHPSVNILLDLVTLEHDLYHGTSPEFLDSIMSKGLLPQSRQYVHLSKDIKTAKTVGKRHSKEKEPIILVIKKDTPIPFFITENGVFHATHIPPEYISILK